MTSNTMPSSGSTDPVTGRGGVLVVGLSHSGKTEVRSLLETSSRMFGARRSRYWAVPDERWGSLEIDSNLESCIAALERSTQAAGWVTDVREVAGYCAVAVASYSTLLACAHQAEARRRGKDAWCVQVGGAEELLPDRLEALPELKVVHMVRDPRDRLSVSRPSPLPGRRGWDLGRWERSVRIGLECRNRFPDRYMLATWEDLTGRPESLAADLAEFVGCRLDPSSVALPSLEKRSPHGGITGPHTVTAVRHLLETMGYGARPVSGVSLADMIELATLLLYRRVQDRRAHYAGGRRPPVVSR